MNLFFLLAALVSFFTCGVHYFAGGKEIARPLLNHDTLHPVVKFTHYYCWHLVTLALFAMSAGFALAAAAPKYLVLGVEWTILAATFAIWNVALFIWKKQSPLQLIQWMLFTPIAVLGAAGTLLP